MDGKIKEKIVMFTRPSFFHVSPCATSAAAATVAVLLAGMVIVGGCGQNKTAGKSLPKTVHLFAGLDTSNGTRRHLGDYMAAVAQITEDGLRSTSDQVTLFRMDAHAQEFFDGAANGDANAISDIITKEVQKNPSQPGTLPENFWKQMTARLESASGRENMVVFLASDGDNDDGRAASQKAISAYAARLARMKNLRAVVLFGVTPENREGLRKTFAPLGERFKIVDADGGCDTTTTLLTAARQQP